MGGHPRVPRNGQPRPQLSDPKPGTGATVAGTEFEAPALPSQMQRRPGPMGLSEEAWLCQAWLWLLRAVPLGTLSTHWPGLQESRTRVRIPTVPRIPPRAKNSRGSRALCKARGPAVNATRVLGSNPDKVPSVGRHLDPLAPRVSVSRMRARVPKGLLSSWRENEKRKRKPLDFFPLLLSRGLGASGRVLRPGGRGGPGGSLPSGVALVKSRARLIWRRVARGKKGKSRGVRVERRSHLPHRFLAPIKHLLLTPSRPEGLAWPVQPLPRCLQPDLIGPHIHPDAGTRRLRHA